ncbi:MAG: hypothetical protein DU480_07475 [Nitrosomonas sp.]|uniref:ceramidase domain-containing protein n=1 Tax=Nitrosomonas sp. TaxID=42353 RepID=UPI0032EEB185
MIIYRGFIVWGVSVVILLGSFFIFVATGWPGAEDSCVNKHPDECYCEAFSLEDVKNGAPGIRQPVNTLFNLYALVTSLLVAFFVYADRKTFGANSAPNLMRSQTWVPDLYIFAVLFLGLGSMWFHASLKAWGGLFDGLSMYVFAAFLGFYSIRRLWDIPWIFWIGYGLTIGLFTFLHTVLPSVVNIIILVTFYAVIEFIVMPIKTGKVLQGNASARWLWGLGLSAMGLATFFWIASQTGNFMCDPKSGFQPHGLLWHPLAGVMAVLLYFFWRGADDRSH